MLNLNWQRGRYQVYIINESSDGTNISLFGEWELGRRGSGGGWLNPLWNSVQLRHYHFTPHTQSFLSTAPRHYRSQVIPFYFPGDPIEIPTVDDNILERSRQFEVRIANLSSNPLNILEPSRVIVTIRDNDGKFRRQ